MRPLRGLRISLPVALLTLILDQISKAVATRTLLPGRPVTIVPGLFDLTLVTNTGGVFGVLRDLDDPIRTLIFSAVPTAAILLMLWYGWSLPAARTWSHAALGLVLGGALGNLVDRFRLGFVIDFLDAYIGPYHWPAFNLADSAICVGVTMLLLENLVFHRSRDGSHPATPPATP